MKEELARQRAEEEEKEKAMAEKAAKSGAKPRSPKGTKDDKKRPGSRTKSAELKAPVKEAAEPVVAEKFYPVRVVVCEESQLLQFLGSALQYWK